MKIHLLILMVVAIVGCRTSDQSASLKDDILVKDDENTLILYWLAGSTEKGHICRARCDEKTMKIEGKLSETRKSCDAKSTQSISAAKFAEDAELKGLLGIFAATEPLSPKGVAILSTKTGNSKIDEKNKTRAGALTALFNDENMYIDPKIDTLRKQGLMPFGVENLNRFHPLCYTANINGNPIGLNEDKKKPQQATDAKPKPSKPVFNKANSVVVPKLVKEAIMNEMHLLAKKQLRPGVARIKSNYSQGNLLLWFGTQKSSVKVNVTAGNRGPAIMNGANVSSYLTIRQNRESNQVWTSMLSAFGKITLKQFGARMVPEELSGNTQGYKVVLSETEGNFSSPKETVYTIFNLIPWHDSNENKFYLQIDVIKNDSKN